MTEEHFNLLMNGTAHSYLHVGVDYKCLKLKIKEMWHLFCSQVSTSQEIRCIFANQTGAMPFQLNHRYYTNNMGLEAPFHTTALLVVTEVINLKVASCTSYVAISVAML